VSTLFIDFEDSFSFNIIQEVQKLGISPVHTLWNNLPPLENFDLVILGPGPGHPNDYEKIFPAIQNYLNTGGRIFGICLGHQIIGCIHGYEIKRCKNPVHGQSIKLQLDAEVANFLGLAESIEVQRYNSLAVVEKPEDEGMRFTVDDEVLIFIREGIITYQFHPESMGTKCRQSYFRPILKYLL